MSAGSRRGVISISGDLGSGKSLIARMLSERLGVEMISTGAIQRQLAAEMGMSTLELNHYAESHPEIDEQIDSRIVEIGKTGDPAVIDSRMAWHFVPHSFKVYLTVDPLVAAQRIRGSERVSEDDYESQEETIRSMKQRRQSERKRFSEYYQVDVLDWNNFDLVINTTNAEPASIVSVVLDAVDDGRAGAGYAYFLSPTACFPTLSDSEAAEHAADATAEMPSIIRSSEVDYIWHGHAAVARALREPRDLMAAHVLARDGEPVEGNGSADALIGRGLSLAALEDWQRALGFRFHRYPPSYD